MPSIYSPLRGAREIRLVHLDASDSDTDLTCNILVAHLGNGIHYTALSYVWGSATDTVTIKCNDHDIAITKNLHLALKRLRAPNKTVVVWADALCINQKDIPERNTQVQMMRDIYSKATSVAAYLGEEENDTRSAFDLSKKLSDLYHLDHMDKRQVVLDQARYHAKPSHYQIPEEHDPAWEALQNIYLREYFCRIWVVQEIAMTATEPQVMCGDSRIGWNKIADATRLLTLHTIRFDKTPTNIADLASLMVSVRESIQQGLHTFQLDLTQLLRTTKNFKATDPRDKVFALLGIAHDIYDSDGSALFKADYNLNVEAVFRTTAGFLIQRSGRLDALAFATNTRQPHRRNLPSWVPDWSAPPVVNPLEIGLNVAGYDADRDMYYRNFLTLENMALVVCTFLVDRVATMYEPFVDEHFGMKIPDRKPQVLLNAWHHFVKPRFPQGTERKNAIQLFWRTLIANQSSTRQEASDTYFIHFLKYWRLATMADNLKQKLDQIAAPEDADLIGVQAALEQNIFQGTAITTEEFNAHLRFAITMAALGQLRPRSTEDLESLSDAEKIVHLSRGLPPQQDCDPLIRLVEKDEIIAEYYRRLREDVYDPLPVTSATGNDYSTSLSRIATNRRLFFTEQGYLGLGPASTQSGDLITVIGGSRTPLILRPRTDMHPDRKAFELVGESYIDSIMVGSAVRNELDETGKPLFEVIQLV